MSRLARSVLAATFLFVGACGSSDDEGPSSATPAPSTTAVTTTPTTTELPASTTTVEPVDAALTEVTLEVGEFVFDAAVAGPSTGELVVLLHGFPQTWNQWRHQIESLTDAGYRVLAPNQRGYSPGARPEAVDDYSLDLIVEDLLGMVDALGRDRFHLVGHDFGGAVVWQAAAQHPDRVASVVAVSTPHMDAMAVELSDPDSDQSARSAYFETFRAEGSEQLFLADDAALLKSLYDQAGITGPDRDAQLGVLANEAGMRAALNWYRAGTITFEPIGPVTIPTMFIWSDEDSALGPDAAMATQEHVTGPYRFEVIEGVNHWVPEQAAEEVSALLVEFFGDQPAVTG